MKTTSFPARTLGLLAGAAMLCLGISASAQPVILNVVETGGDNELTDTILAKWTGMTFPVSVANEPMPGLVIGDNYTVGLFGNWAPAYVDRTHRYTNASDVVPIPPYLVGAEYIMSGNDNRDNAGYRLDVSISRGATVFMLIDNRLSDGDNATPPTFDATHMQWILDQGWTGVFTGANRTSSLIAPDEVGFDEGSDGTWNQWLSVYQKYFEAGTFSLYQADNSGRNMYGVAVIPEPGTMSLLASGLLLLGLGLRRHRAP